MDREEFKKAYGKLVAKVWLDAEFKQRLMSDPSRVFKENGIMIPEGFELNMAENTLKFIDLISLPTKTPEHPSDRWFDNAANYFYKNGEFFLYWYSTSLKVAISLIIVIKWFSNSLQNTA